MLLKALTYVGTLINYWKQFFREFSYYHDQMEMSCHVGRKSNHNHCDQIGEKIDTSAEFSRSFAIFEV